MKFLTWLCWAVTNLCCAGSAGLKTTRVAVGASASSRIRTCVRSGPENSERRPAPSSLGSSARSSSGGRCCLGAAAFRGLRLGGLRSVGSDLDFCRAAATWRCTSEALGSLDGSSAGIMLSTIVRAVLSPTAAGLGFAARRIRGARLRVQLSGRRPTERNVRRRDSAVRVFHPAALQRVRAACRRRMRRCAAARAWPSRLASPPPHHPCHA
eukprot:scaffold35226_cov66-Phaeocystis_antarctica.AAC.5